MFVNAIVPLLTVLAWPVSEDVPLSDAAELCIHKAEVCVLEIAAEVCGEPSSESRSGCISAYEDCSYDIPDAHGASCRLEYVWCRLEADSATWLPVWMEHCEDVYAACPTLW
jgi:hypothetical protein